MLMTYPDLPWYFGVRPECFDKATGSFKGTPQVRDFVTMTVSGQRVMSLFTSKALALEHHKKAGNHVAVISADDEESMAEILEGVQPWGVAFDFVDVNTPAEVHEIANVLAWLNAGLRRN